MSQHSREEGNEELLNKGDFNTKQNPGIAGDIEMDMKTFRPDPETRKHRAIKGETKLDNHMRLGTTKLIMTGIQEGHTGKHMKAQDMGTQV